MVKVLLDDKVNRTGQVWHIRLAQQSPCSPPTLFGMQYMWQVHAYSHVSHASVHVSVHMSAHMSVHMSVHMSLHMSLHASSTQFWHAHVHTPPCMPMRMSVHMPVQLSAHM